MSSRATGEASRLTSALTGANLALSIAREATDAVPIVKQVLGAALRIVGLAEKMENDREALRALAESSLQLAQQVRDVMDGKTPDSATQAVLERVLGALEGIEAFMKKHAAHNRLRRLVSYAFTVPQHVKRLSGELGDAVRNLTVVVLLATHAAVQDSVRFEGKFRLLRDCEVDKLELIEEQAIGNNAIIRYHRAKVDGKLLVVRYFEGGIPQHSSSRQTPEERMLNRIEYHDSILEEISTLQRSHPNVARIYGWSRGSCRDRFTVFKSGYQPVDGALHNSPNPLITAVDWTLKDAVHHVQLMGIDWNPSESFYELDDQLQPIIGLQNDLLRMNQGMDRLSVAQLQIYRMAMPLWVCAERQFVPATQIQKSCPTERLADILGRMEKIQRHRYLFPKAELPGRLILTDGAAKRLLRIVEHEILEDGGSLENWTWANTLLSSGQNGSHPLMHSFQAVYHIQSHSVDMIRLYGMDQDSERIVHDSYTFDVPLEQQDEVRGMFGISVPSEEEIRSSQLIATGTYRMLLD